MAKGRVSEVEGRGVSQESAVNRLPGVLEDKGPLFRVPKGLKKKITLSGKAYWYIYLSDYARMEFKNISSASKYFFKKTLDIVVL